MRRLVSHRAWIGIAAAIAVIAVIAAAGVFAPGRAWAQPATPPAAPEVAAPAAAAAPAAPAAPGEGSDEDVPNEEALERIDQVLDDVEERIEDNIDDIDGDSVEAMRERRERVREIRAQVRDKLRDGSDNKVSFGSSITVPEGEVARDVVAIGGQVEVEGDVEGDVVAVGGPVRINGKVTGDVVSVGSSVDLGDDAEVLGEVTSVGGRVARADGAEVLGRINEVALGPSFTWNVGDDDHDDIDWWGWRPRHRDLSPFNFGWFGFGLSLIGLVVLAILTLLTRLIAGGTVERVRAKAVEAPWTCALVGLAVELLFLPVLIVVTLILAISIIGIPLLLLLPFVVLAFLLALLVGFTGVAQAVGDWIGGRFNRPSASPYISVIVGVGLIQVLHLIAEFLDSFEGPLWFFAVMFGIAGVLVRYLAWTVGIGAVFLTAVRRSAPPAMAIPPPPSPAGYSPNAAYSPPESVPPSDWSSEPLGDGDRSDPR